MSKRTLGLILVLIVITAALMIAAFSSAPARRPQQTLIITPTITPYIGHTVISLVPQASAATPSTPPIDVNVDSGGDSLTGIQVEIAYDPTIVTNVHIKPSTFFTDPFVLINKNNTTDGRISYAIAIKLNGNAVSGSGTAANITYSLMPGAKANQVYFSLLDKTKATAEGIGPSVLKSVNNYKAGFISPTPIVTGAPKSSAPTSTTGIMHPLNATPENGE